MKTSLLLLLLFACLFQIGCRRSATTAINHGNIIVTVYHQVDGAQLIADTAIYTNAAQNKYSVEKLEYYLSDFKIYRNSKLCYSGNEAILINALSGSDISFDIILASGLPAGTYDSVSFYIGLDSVLNIPYGLPQTLDNLDMSWPDAMGGGYHFLKLEGHYINNGALAGYAMHLGQDGFQVSAGTHCNIHILPSGDAELKMTMNVNEWFRNPAVYDFNTDGVFSMGNATLMRKLALNGADVFTAN